MKTTISLKTLAATACVAVLTLAASGAAQAHGDNIYWSIGMSSPGVQVGVASAPPVVMYPPIYAVPRPVVYMPPPVVYGPPGWQRRHHGHHGRSHGYDDERHGGGHGYQERREGHRH